MSDSELLLPLELASRWRVSEDTLRQWRYQRKGPPYIKIEGKVFYEIQEVKKYEENHRVRPE